MKIGQRVWPEPVHEVEGKPVLGVSWCRPDVVSETRDEMMVLTATAPMEEQWGGYPD